MAKKTKKPIKKSGTSYEIWKIDWKDHTADTGPWIDVIYFEQVVVTISTVGFKIAEDSEAVTLALNLSQNHPGRVSNCMTILKDQIVSKQKLGVITVA